MADSPTNPSWLDKGDNAWQLTAGSLVALQSIPGLVCIYAGKSLNALQIVCYEADINLA
jgi:ammonia channel protein AmtB